MDIASLLWHAQYASISTRELATRSPRRWIDSRAMHVRVVFRDWRGRTRYFIVLFLLRLSASRRVCDRAGDSMPKPVCRHFRPSPGRWIEFALSLRSPFAEIETLDRVLEPAHLDSFPRWRNAGCQLYHRNASRAHCIILMGQPLNPREAEKDGWLH